MRILDYMARPSARRGALAGVLAGPVAAALLLAPPAAGQQVTQLVLVDACTDQDIRPLAAMDTIDLSQTGSCLNVRAEVSGPVESVRFAFDGDPNFQTENAPPYALAGDSGGDYNPWTPSLGAHTLTATPYPPDNAGGSPGTALTVQLQVVQEGGLLALVVLVVAKQGLFHLQQVVVVVD